MDLVHFTNLDWLGTHKDKESLSTILGGLLGKVFKSFIVMLVLSITSMTYGADLTFEVDHPTPQIVDGYHIYVVLQSDEYGVGVPMLGEDGQTPGSMTHLETIAPTEWTIYKAVATAWNIQGTSGYSPELLFAVGPRPMDMIIIDGPPGAPGLAIRCQ